MTTETETLGTALRDAADRLFQARCDTAVLRAADAGTWPAALWNEVEAAGLHRALVPESAGGFGVPVAEALSLLRVAAFHAVPLPLAETMLAGWLLARAGLEIPDGPLSVGPVTRGESAAVQNGRLAGTLTRVPWGRSVAGIVIVLEDAVVLAGRDAIAEVTPGENIAREPRDRVRFAGPVTMAPAVGTPDVLRLAGAVARTQQIAGALQRVSDMSVQYAQDRVQFGRPIGKFQAVQQNLAVLAGQAAAAGAAADLAAEAFADDMRLAPIAAGKARAGEAAGIAAGIAHQVHGAIGFTFEHDLHFLTRRLWSWRDEFGHDTAWNRLLGQQMIRAGADALWPSITAA